MKRLKSVLLPTILFGALAVIFTFPLVLHIKEALPGSADAYFYPWNIWHFQTKLRNFEDPFSTKDILYPQGSNLFFHAYGTFTSLFALPVSLPENLILYQNIVLLSGLVLSALSAYFLIKYLVGKEFPAIVGGFVYGFNPLIFASISRGHYYFSHAEFVPLGLLVLFKYLEKPTFKKALLFAIVVLVSFFNEYYQTVFLSLTSLLLLIFYFFWKGKNLFEYLKFLMPLSLSFILLALLIFPLIYPLFGQEFQRRPPGRFLQAGTCSADVFQFLLPSQFNPLLSPLSANLSKILNVNPVPDTPAVYFGLTTLGLSLFSIWRLRKEKKVGYFGVLALFGYLLSLGPTIKFGKALTLPGPLAPFWYFSQVPFINNARCPVRFNGIAFLALAVLVAFGINQILKIKNKQARRLLAGLAAFAVLFEFFTFNFPLTQAKAPAVYKILSGQEQKTLLELPSGVIDGFEAFGSGGYQDDATFQMYLQAIHKKPRIGGYLARIPDSTFNFFRSEPVISDLFRLTDFGTEARVKDYKRDEIEKFINKFNLGYIILWTSKHQSLTADYIEKNFESFVISKDEIDGFIIFFIR